MAGATSSGSVFFSGRIAEDQGMSRTPQAVPTRETLADLARTPGKAELIGGRIVNRMPTGHTPNRVAARIFRSLDEHAERTGRGVAYTDNMGFAVPELSSGRQSFSPDAAFYLGPLPSDWMNFVEGPPTLAVEVRSKGDFGPAAEAEMAAKRADYFEAGTFVVWDVDPKSKTVSVYRSDTPDQPTTFHPGEEADAEPAVMGWRIASDWLFA
jgi:Uma2 family endonuclease